MFPNDCLETVVKFDEIQSEMTLEIKLTTPERQAHRKAESLANARH